MSTHPLRFAGAIALVSGIAMSTNVLATTVLDPITITASRTATLAERLPTADVIIDRQAIEQSTATNLPELLSELGGLHTLRISSDSDAGATVDLLGFGSTGAQNTLILLDGQRITPPDLSGVDFSAIPLNAIERIEVLPATGSVLYGVGASAGAINIITRQYYQSGGRIELRSGSYQTRGGLIEGAASNDAVSAMASASAKRSDGYRDNSDSRSKNAFANLRHQNDRVALYLSALAKQQELRLPGSLNFNSTDTSLRDHPRSTDTPLDWSEDKNVTLLPGATVSLFEQLTLTLEGSLGRREQSFYYDGSFGFSNYGDTVIDSHSVTPRLNWNFSTAGIRHELIAGIDRRETDYRADRALNEASKDMPIHKIDTEQLEHSDYIVDLIGLTERLTITLGARRTRIHNTGTDRYDGTAPAAPGSTDAQAAPLDQRLQTEQWQVGAQYQLNDNFDLFANAEKSARIAKLDEIYESKYDFLSGTSASVFEPLNAQTGRTYSAGASWHSERQYSTLLFWQGDYEDEILFDAGTFDNVNIDPTRRKGVSLNSRWALDKNLWLTVNGSLQQARFRDGVYAGNYVPAVPDQLLFSRLDWRASHWLNLSLAHTYVGKKYFENDQSNNFGQRIPSYRYTDLVARMTFQAVYASLGAYNLENENHFDFGVSGAPGRYNGYPLPGRHLMGSIGVTF